MKTRFTFLLIVCSIIVNGQSNQVEKLSKLYMSGDMDQTIIIANEYLKNDPNNVDYKLILGRALTDKGNYEKAIPNLIFANNKADSWRKAWALSYLGTCYFMQQKYDDSEKMLNECINLNATKNATNDAYGKTLYFGYNEFYKSWRVVETENFRFHFQDMNDIEIEKYTLLRENAYQKINSFFKSSLPKKIDFYVWESREDARNILRRNLGFADPTYCIVHTHFKQTIGHEMTHIISYYTTDISKTTAFINEGTAVSFDQSHQNRISQITSWIETNNKPISIRDFWEKGREYEEEILYPVSGLFVTELIENFGREKFLDFFKDQSYKNAKIVFGDELDNVIEGFENKINK